MTEPFRCALCGEPLPEGEEMFKFHGYSGPCPKPPIVAPQNVLLEKETAMKPTVGRMVHYYRWLQRGISTGHEGPLSATVAAVSESSPTRVNLMVLNEDGTTFGRQGVAFVGESEEVPQSEYCTWPPRVGEKQDPAKREHNPVHEQAKRGFHS